MSGTLRRSFSYNMRSFLVAAALLGWTASGQAQAASQDEAAWNDLREALFEDRPNPGGRGCD